MNLMLQSWPEDCCVLAVSMGNLAHASRSTARAIATGIGRHAMLNFESEL